VEYFDFNEFLGSVKERISFVGELDDFADEAKAISPDREDWAYFAAALVADAPIWSNDKALKKQDRVRVYNTAELLKELGL
jgi:predicted nucleic acid-binding protein